MNCTDCSSRLQDYVDGEIATADAAAVETHLSHCASCRAERDALRRLCADAQTLPRELPPRHDLWPGIATELAATGSHRAADALPRGAAWKTFTRPGAFLEWLAPLGMAAAIVALASFAERGIAPSSSGAAWSVAALSGAPRLDARAVRHEATFRLGQWLETDAASRAKVAVGSIGEVNVEPNSRLRLTGVSARDHRLELSRGTLNALIWAPPRLFFVNTPSATAVDLGCAYTLSVDDAGNGELHVTAGYVALEDGDRESIVRYGMRCATRRGFGPGTPFADDAPDALRAALARFDFEHDRTALDEVLRLARPEDAVTLWHLLTRTDGTQRTAVYDLLAKHAPPPEGVTRAGILAGNRSMRETWGNELGLLRF